jgi:uncharacterized protein (DUF2252 family)
MFYRWLAGSDVASAIPSGPSIWICGDSHVGNLGPVADAERRVDIQIRDLDQTVIGNPAYDLIRLGLSLETAARSSDLPGVATARMVEAMLAGYASALSRGEDDAREPDVVRTVRKEAAGRRWRHLAKERLEDVEPSIPLGKRFWKLSGDEQEALITLFEGPEVRRRALDLAGLDKHGHIRVADAAYWRKGCSSLGNLRYAVLLGVEAKGATSEKFALVDIKEAVPSVAPAAKEAKMPADAAERVVAGARALSPNLGERMIPAHLLSKPVVMRELAPQDLKIEIAQFSRREAIQAAAYLASVIGSAHARQLDRDEREKWHKQLTEERSGDLDAPSWLWRSIIELAGAHETAYLEHCRRFALSA